MTEKKIPRKTIWFRLRNGHVIRMRARELNLTIDNGKVTSYAWSGSPARSWHFWRRRLLFLNPEEIVAVEIRGG